MVILLWFVWYNSGLQKTYQLYSFCKNHHMFEPFSQSGFSFALLPPFAIKVFSWSVNCVHLWPRPVAIHFITKQVANYKLMLFHIKYDRIMGAGDELEIIWHHKGPKTQNDLQILYCHFEHQDLCLQQNMTFRLTKSSFWLWVRFK